MFIIYSGQHYCYFLHRIGNPSRSACFYHVVSRMPCILDYMYVTSLRTCADNLCNANLLQIDPDRRADSA